MKATRCPDCNQRVYTLTITGVTDGYYQLKEPTLVEKQAFKKMGMPFRSYEKHKCQH